MPRPSALATAGAHVQRALNTERPCQCYSCSVNGGKMPLAQKKDRRSTGCLLAAPQLKGLGKKIEILMSEKNLDTDTTKWA